MKTELVFFEGLFSRYFLRYLQKRLGYYKPDHVYSWMQGYSMPGRKGNFIVVTHSFGSAGIEWAQKCIDLGAEVRLLALDTRRASFNPSKEYVLKRKFKEAVSVYRKGFMSGYQVHGALNYMQIGYSHSEVVTCHRSIHTLEKFIRESGR